jgi:hypothetical protein
MPRAELPSSFGGWMLALFAAFVGFVAGFVTIRVLGPRFGAHG